LLFLRCAGKTSSWKILKLALEQTQTRKISTYVIDPKALTKDELYGSLDSTTLEFTDGVLSDHALTKHEVIESPGQVC
jgi:dynein heavy chain 1